jgi:hypothetical protein
MKNLLTIVALIIGFSSVAQSLPRKSTFSKIEQTVGLNNIEISYSRPNVRGREIFGDIFPYNEVWRFGANEPTKVHFSEPITISGQELDSGLYAIFAVPTSNQWMIAFNSNTDQWGSSDYDPAKNVLEYTTAVSTCDHVETFSLAFEQIEEASAVLTIRWATTEVKVPFTTDTKTVIERNIKSAIEKGENLARVYYNAADYYNEEGETEKANMHLAKSLKIEKSYYNTYLEAQMMRDTDLDKAKKVAEEAAKLAEKAEKQGWADYIRRNLGEW